MRTHTEKEKARFISESGRRELKGFCHEIKEGGDGFNYLPWRLRERITQETH